MERFKNHNILDGNRMYNSLIIATQYGWKARVPIQNAEIFAVRFRKDPVGEVQLVRITTQGPETGIYRNTDHQWVKSKFSVGPENLPAGSLEAIAFERVLAMQQQEASH